MSVWALGINHTTAPLDLRVNTLKTNREAVLARLAADDISAIPGPLCPLTVNTYDFSQTGELIRRAETTTGHWLKDGLQGKDPRWALAPHRHRAG